MANIDKKTAIDQLWRRGLLDFKLDRNQKELKELYIKSEFKTHTWLLARRSGKSYALCVLALEQCIKKPNSIVKFIAPTKLQVNNIVRPIFRQLLEDCPEDIKPSLKEKDYIYYFPNGSEIQLAGSDGGHAEKLRGGDAHIGIIDEAGSCSDLDYLIKSILLPTTLITKGKIIIAGTPPPDTDHEFLNFIEEAELRGTLLKKTIYDNPRIDNAMINEIIKEYGGTNSSAFKRECLCEIVKSSDTSAIPEFTDELIAKIVMDWPPPPFYDCYESMDIGGKDLTAVLFGYFDFRADKVIIQDEIVVEGKDLNLQKLANDIESMEKRLWYNVYTQEVKKPYQRYSDINYIAINDIRKHSQGRVTFQITKKDHKESAVNDLRVLLQQEKIIIHPRCKFLIRHLKNVKWSKSKTKAEFARSPDDSHYDTVDACIYMVRNIAYGKNPYPASYGINMKDLYIRSNQAYGNSGSNSVDVFQRIFKMKEKKDHVG